MKVAYVGLGFSIVGLALAISSCILSTFISILGAYVFSGAGLVISITVLLKEGRKKKG